VELLKQLTEPRRLGHAVSHEAILGLGAGAGDDQLPLRGPRDKTVAQEHSIARSGLARVGATSPVSVDCEVDGRRAMKEAEVEGAPEGLRICFIAVRYGSRGSCIWRHTCWTAYAMSGRVKTRYRKAPTILR
jgi:hypothetical protein